MFLGLTPEKEKSTESPCPWWIALLVELGPGVVLVIFALIHVEYFDKTLDCSLNLGTPSLNLWSEYKHSSQWWPILWCHRIRSVWTWILLTGMDWKINSQNGVASRVDCRVVKSLPSSSQRASKYFKIHNSRQFISINCDGGASSSSRAFKAALRGSEITYKVACSQS